jgi:hypothetical protein
MTGLRELGRMMNREDGEREAERLVAERAADPDGLITDERMERGFNVAETMAQATVDAHSNSYNPQRKAHP